MPYVATFIAAPGGLTEERVEGFRDAWRGCRAGPARWLSPGEAAAVELDRQPEGWAEAAARLHNVDLCLQRAGDRRRRLLLADMDSAMIQQECIDELAAEAGVGAEVAAITARAMNGEIDFPAALRARVALLRGLPVAAIAAVLRDRIALMPGGPALVATMNRAGAHTILISGGFSSFARPLAERLGFREARANVLVERDGVLTGEVAEPILGREAKAEALMDACARLGIAPADAMAVGDGANDLGMLRLAGTGVALHAKPAVQAEVALRVNHGDLTALLFLQGYGRDEFAA